MATGSPFKLIPAGEHSHYVIDVATNAVVGEVQRLTEWDFTTRESVGQPVYCGFTDGFACGYQCIEDAAQVVHHHATTFAKLNNLQPNWDSYGGLHPTQEAISVAKGLANALLSLPHVVPVATGGVQLEWHVAGFDIEIEVGPDGSCEALVERVSEVPA